MKRPLRRQVPGYVLGILTACAGFTAATALAGGFAGGDNTISACAKKGDGQLYLPGANGACKHGDEAVQWSVTGPVGPQGQQGARGPAGSITSAKSPNGLFTITLSNKGILLAGPRGTLTINLTGAQMNTIGGATP